MSTKQKPPRATLDLSALEQKVPPSPPPEPAPAGDGAERAGARLFLIADILEDPNQPRKKFDPVTIAQMAETIKVRGVKTPISLRPHPDKPGKWLVNHGARRLRASIEAGKEDIPGIVDLLHDDYDQVIENLQREDLKPMELALFVHSKIAAGEKKGAVAKALGLDASFVTNHLALIDAPACIEAVYASGRCTSAKTLYELRSLYDKYPEQVEAWANEAEDITRRSVAALASELKGAKGKPTAKAAPPAEDGNLDMSKSSAGGGDNAPLERETNKGSNVGSDGGSGEPKAVSFKNDQGRDPSGSGREDEEADRGELTSWPRGKAVSDPDLMRKPLLIVEVDGRAAAVLLNRRPTSPGLLRIRWEDGGGDAEVDAGICKINLLAEGEK